MECRERVVRGETVTECVSCQVILVGSVSGERCASDWTGMHGAAVMGFLGFRAFELHMPGHSGRLNVTEYADSVHWLTAVMTTGLIVRLLLSK